MYIYWSLPVHSSYSFVIFFVCVKFWLCIVGPHQPFGCQTLVTYLSNKVYLTLPYLWGGLSHFDLESPSQWFHSLIRSGSDGVIGLLRASAISRSLPLMYLQSRSFPITRHSIPWSRMGFSPTGRLSTAASGLRSFYTVTFLPWVQVWTLVRPKTTLSIPFSIWLWCFSVSVRALEAYWTGWPPCIRQAPPQFGFLLQVWIEIF